MCHFFFIKPNKRVVGYHSQAIVAHVGMWARLPSRLMLWFTGCIAGQDHWCLHFPSSLHSIFWSFESQQTGNMFTAQLQLTFLYILQPMHISLATLFKLLVTRRNHTDQNLHCLKHLCPVAPPPTRQLSPVAVFHTWDWKFCSVKPLFLPQGYCLQSLLCSLFGIQEDFHKTCPYSLGLDQSSIPYSLIYPIAQPSILRLHFAFICVLLTPSFKATPTSKFPRLHRYSKINKCNQDLQMGEGGTVFVLLGLAYPTPDIFSVVPIQLLVSIFFTAGFHVHFTFSFCIPQLMTAELLPLALGSRAAVTMDVRISTYRCGCRYLSMVQNALGVFPGVVQLGHTVLLSLGFIESFRLIAKFAAPTHAV